VDSKRQVATALGYALSVASVFLYAPVAVRVARQREAEGLSLSTWWFKAAGFSIFLVYAIRNDFPVAQFGDTAILTAESLLVLALIAYFKTSEEKLEEGFEAKFWGGLAALAVGVTWGVTAASEDALKVAQAGAVLTQKGALLPQIRLNFERKGCDYSPVTSFSALVGSAIKCFTTVELAHGDPLLLVSFGSGAALNFILLSQALYFGVIQEQKTLGQVFSADFMEREREEKAVV